MRDVGNPQRVLGERQVPCRYFSRTQSLPACGGQSPRESFGMVVVGGVGLNTKQKPTLLRKKTDFRRKSVTERVLLSEMS